MHNKPRRLSGIVKNISDPIFGKKSMLYSQLVENWFTIVGEETASYSLPIELKFKRSAGKQNSAVLKLAVSSARAQDLLMQKDLLIEKLNQFMGFAAIEDIQLVHRPHTQISETSRHIQVKKPVSKEKKEEISKSVSNVENEGLKDALQALGNAISSRQNNDEALKNKD